MAKEFVITLNYRYYFSDESAARCFYENEVSNCKLLCTDDNIISRKDGFYCMTPQSIHDINFDDIDVEPHNS